MMLRPKHNSAGFSLIELMVAMVIGLVLTVAISRVLIYSDSSRRNATSLNDINQTGAYTAYELDRAIRSAGSGFMQSWDAARGDALGCALSATRNNVAILPRTTPMAAPFHNQPLTARLAPVVISRGTDSDILTVMSGTNGYAEVSRQVLPNSVQVTPPSASLLNTFGWNEGDVLLLAASGVGCTVQQVGAITAGSSEVLPFAGPYFRAEGLAAFTPADTFAIALGNISNTARNNPPQFQVFGVNPANNTLVSYDLLTSEADADPMPIADGVVELRALYGIDTNADGLRDRWQPPTGDFADTVLRNGSGASQLRLRQIVSIRLGMTLRSTFLERLPPTTDNPEGYVVPETLPLLAGEEPDLVARTLTDTERHFRHRVIEVTIPLRNAILQ